MRYCSKILLAICTGLWGWGISASALPVMADEAVQQTGTTVQVRGVVLDSEGQPVIGASVIEVGSKSNGTLTAPDGSFSLSVARGASLRISYVGYKTAEVRAVAGRRLSVTLEEDAEVLSDVVVVGYGTQRKKLVTGSTVHVTSENIEAVNAVDAFGALQSLASGMNIVMNSGQPGEGYKVVIRGMGTVGSNTPLYVVDGVPGANIDDLSPNDIESIDILKDAASSAIYGARASNGVVLVTTKKGRASGGRIRVSFDGYLGWQNVNTNGVTPLNAPQYMEIINKAREIQGVEPYVWENYIPKQYALIQNGSWNGTNWLEETWR